MEQPDGCIDSVTPEYVCKLIKAIYGLKQAHRQWHKKIDTFLIVELGFKTTRSDPCLYIKRDKSTVMIIALYVDDLLLAGSDLAAVDWMKSELRKRFEMKDLGEAKVCIGLEISRDRKSRTIRITQSKYAGSVLDRFNMSACNPCATPMEKNLHPEVISGPVSESPYRQAIGCLMFLMVGTRPDLAYAVGKLSQHCEQPLEGHWGAVKRVLRYVRGTQSQGIVLGYAHGDVSKTGNEDLSSVNLVGYSDADWGGCLESRKSTSGFVFKLCGGAISWCSRKQTVVATSTCEAEYLALKEACKEAAWLRRMVADLLELPADPTIEIACDNSGTIHFATNESTNRRNKHIDISYHFVRDAIKTKLVRLHHVPSAKMTADILTKPLGRLSFQKLVGYLGLN